jgi:hypothetical protein
MLKRKRSMGGLQFEVNNTCIEALETGEILIELPIKRFPR